jgi:hypothetical protein
MMGRTSNGSSLGAHRPSGDALCGCGHEHITIEQDGSAPKVSRQRLYQIRKRLLRLCRVCGRYSGGASRCPEHRYDGVVRKKTYGCGICGEKGHNARSHYVDDPEAIEDQQDTST